MRPIADRVAWSVCLSVCRFHDKIEGFMVAYEIGNLRRAYFWTTVCKMRFALCYLTAILSVLSVCNVGVLWPNGWMDQDATWYEDRSRPRPHVLDGDPTPTERGTEAPLRDLRKQALTQAF